MEVINVFQVIALMFMALCLYSGLSFVWDCTRSTFSWVKRKRLANKKRMMMRA